MANPDFDRRFAETGVKTAIGGVEYDGGWDDIVADQPPLKADFNSVMNEQDLKLAFLNTVKNQAWADTGIVNAYVVDVTGSVAFDLYDGFEVKFKPALPPTGASTLEGIWTDAVKSITFADGTATSTGDLLAETLLSYNLANDRFEIVESGGGGGTSLGNDNVIRTNPQNITEDITFAGTENGMSAGPITIDTGFTVTVTTGSTYTVV